MLLHFLEKQNVLAYSFMQYIKWVPVSSESKGSSVFLEDSCYDTFCNYTYMFKLAEICFDYMDIFMGH